jgi:signal peptidase I
LIPLSILILALIAIGIFIYIGSLRIATTVFRATLASPIIMIVLAGSLVLFSAISAFFGFVAKLYDSNAFIILQLVAGIIPWILTFVVMRRTQKITALRSAGLTLVTSILCVGISMVVVSAFRVFAFQAFRIPSVGMEPAMLVGDHLLVNKFIHRFVPPSRGDVIVFRYPIDPTRELIKRIVAIEGESVEICDKKLLVNGLPLGNDPGIYLEADIQQAGSSPRDNFGPVIVPHRSLFVMGDNRDRSFDSRFWGFVKLSEVRGKASVIYLSIDYKNNWLRTERFGTEIK